MTDMETWNLKQQNLTRQFVNVYRNTLVLDDFHIKKLVGWILEPEDMYYVLIDNYEYELASCVGKLIPLIIHLPKSEYSRLLNMWDLNKDALKITPEEWLSRYKKKLL